MAGLIQNGNWTDWWYDTNLQNIPTDIFDVPWIYTTTFSAPSIPTGGHALIRFFGVNYRATITLNNETVATMEEIVGPFRYFEFDITDMLQPLNTLAVQVKRPQNTIHSETDTDLAISFVDWAPLPPDQNMGLWREVRLVVVEGPVGIGMPMVNTTAISPARDQASLVVLAELTNYGNVDVTGTVEASCMDLSFRVSALVTVPATGKPFPVVLPSVSVRSPKLWWPQQMGAPALYNLTLRFTPSVLPSEATTAAARFGIRMVSDEVVQLSPATPAPNRPVRLYKVNGVPVLVRGAGWSPDLFLRASPQRQRAEFERVLDMGLNAVRLEGKMEDDSFFELADEMGILIIPGWCCCDSWQHWDHWGDEQYSIAGASMRDQLRRLRIHPSVLAFWYSSDTLPPVAVEQVYLDAIAETKWPNPWAAAASNMVSKLTGPTAIKMSGPYSWVPPVYWLQGDQPSYPENGAAYGFLTEGGPGQAPLTQDALQRVIAPAHLWPINAAWNWHCGAQFGHFRSLDEFTAPLNARYGPSASAAVYSFKSQVAAYESHRAMFEAYSRNKYRSTGVIQWMLGNSFPSMIWHLYDYFLNAGGSYFGTKKACEPYHAMYSPHDNSLWVVSSRYAAAGPYVLAAALYDLQGHQIATTSFRGASLAADATLRVGDISAWMPAPSAPGNATVVLVRLQLSVDGAAGLPNWYWLSSAPDALNWAKTDWYHTPTTASADFTALSALPSVDVRATLLNTTRLPTGRLQSLVSLRSAPANTAVAFAAQARLNAESGAAMWDDNFVTLLPGEERLLTATTDGPAPPTSVTVDVWNNLVASS